MYSKSNPINELNNITINEDELLINWIGQAGFVFKTSRDTVICIDPYLSNSIEKYEGRPTRRMWFNKLKYDCFKPDLVLCSHDHLDHTDPETIPLIYAHSNACFWGPRQSYIHMRNMKIPEKKLKVLKRDQEYSFQDIRLKTTYAKHTEDSIGFILYINDLTIYLTGDTSLDKILYEINDDIDIMISCINGKYGNLNIKESINLANKLSVKTIIPMHYGLIPNNTVDISDFVEGCSKFGINPLIFESERNYILNKRENEISLSKI